MTPQLTALRKVECLVKHLQKHMSDVSYHVPSQLPHASPQKKWFDRRLVFSVSNVCSLEALCAPEEAGLPSKARPTFLLNRLPVDLVH